jgi:hypothetical protein
MKLFQSLALLSLATAVLLANPVTIQESELEQVVKTGEASSQVLLKTLGSKLKEHMEKGSVMNAFEFCSNEAYSLTQEVNKGLENGVSIKRISTKFRSPANEPKADESAVLEEFAALKTQNALPAHIVKQIDEKTFKYYKPLVIDKEVCLKCHGKIYKDTDLKKAVEARYPLDKAVDYEMGDLRGAVVVTITK